MGGAEVEIEKTIRQKGTLHNPEKDCRRFEIPDELVVTYICTIVFHNAPPRSNAKTRI
jgi:hypothetical protein